MDDDLGVLYRAAKVVAPNPVLFKKINSDEWKLREKTCADRVCIIDWYTKRSAQLTTVLNHSQIRANDHPTTVTVVTAAPITPVAAPDTSSDGSWTFYLIVGGAAWMLWAFKKGRDKSRVDVGKGRADSSSNKQGISLVTEVSAAGSAAKRRSGKRFPTVWIPPGQSVSVASLTLPGGMLYVGSSLTAADGGSEPGEIDPQLPVESTSVDLSERLFSYWPRYDSISPQARRAYLTWLTGGRRDPTANIGYVFLFYYGLERRALVDAATDDSAKAEIPKIIREIERLRSIYSNGSFQRYSSDLIGFLESREVGPRMYLENPPPVTHSGSLPLRMRVGLAQSAVEGKPVSVEWALAWVKSDANIHLPTVAKRCAEQFDAQFRQVYQKQFGGGLQLAVNRTRLKVSYRPASGGLLTQTFTLDIGDLPDITTVVTPVKKLQAIVDESAAALDAYSRFIGRHADKAQSLESTLLLPPALWTDGIKHAVENLNKRVGSGMIVIKLGELLAAFGGSVSPTRERLKNLFSVLQDQSVGVEPDVLAGAKMPKSDDSVVLFRLAAEVGSLGGRATSSYEAVAVMLDLAITLANADGRITGREVQFLNRQVDAWSHVGVSAQKRLRARLRLGIVYPPTLASLKSRVQPLPANTRAALAKLLSDLALADGKLSPAAVRHLEKVYQVLGIEAAALYSELHVASAAAQVKAAAAITVPTPGSVMAPAQAPLPATSSVSESAGAKSVGGLQLDATRIAALQVETERVTALLTKVFEEQEPAPPAAVAPAEETQDPDAIEATPCLLGLDAEHSAFLRVLLNRPLWSRSELADIATDMELMLDGALERINEVSLDAFEGRITEGDDPIEVAQDLMENVSA